MQSWTLGTKELAHLTVAITEHANAQVARAAGDDKATEQAIARRDRHLDLAKLPPWYEINDLLQGLGADDLA